MHIPKIVILGAGISGRAAALELAGLVKSGQAEITVVNDSREVCYPPNVYKIIDGAKPQTLSLNLDSIFRPCGINFLCDRVIKVSLKNKTVELGGGKEITFDHLVLTMGSEVDFGGISGLSEYAYSIQNPRDAISLRAHILREIKIIDKDINIVIAGGGPRGVEIAGIIAELVREELPEQSRVKIELIEESVQILPRVRSRTRKLILARLHSLGVKVVTKVAVKKEKFNSIMLSDGKISSDTLIWAAGMKPNRLVKDIRGLMLDRSGRIVVDGYLRAAGRDNIWAAGDIASVFSHGGMQCALDQGKLIAHNLLQSINDQSLFVYVPREHPIIISVGKNYAVFENSFCILDGWLASWFMRSGVMRITKLTTTPRTNRLQIDAIDNRLSRN